MFTSVLFDDINKDAFDVLKDGYCFDQKATLKYSRFGCNMTLEGKNLTSALSGKFSIDFKPHKYLNIKKMSLESEGNAICDVDMPNLVKGTTLMFRTQADASTYALKKATCGVKYLSSNFAMDFNYDLLAKKVSSSTVFAYSSVLVGVKGSRNKEGENNIDLAAACMYRKVVLSMASYGNFSGVDMALYTKCRKNVKLGVTCKLPIDVMKPQLAFGVCILPTTTSEFRTKVDAEGRLAVFYKTQLVKNVTISATGSTDFHDMVKGNHKVGIAMEVRL